MKAQEGKTYLVDIPHEGGKIAFQYTPFRGNYVSLASQIDGEGLQRPTSSQTASLIYDSLQNMGGKYESEILKILKDSWFVEFTGNLYLPKREGEEVHNGVIVEDNPTIENGRSVMDRKNLIKRLKKNDPNVRFVPFGFATSEQSALKLAKNSYILARYGEEGADKISELASRYKKNPHICSFDFVNSETVKMSALIGGDWDFGGRLCVFGDWNVGNEGLAFGLKK